MLTRIGLGRRSRLEPPEPANRYERSRPGEVLHVDVKKLGRICGAGHRVSGSRASQRKVTINGKRTGAAGWEFVHVCVDDATRLAYVEVLEDEKAATAVGFLRRAVAHFRAYGIQVERVMTDNGPAYRAVVHALACKALRIKHLRTRPYRPRTNGCESRTRLRLGPLPGSTPMLLVRDSTKRLARLDAFALSCPLEQLGAGLAPARWPDQKPVRPRA